MEELYYILNGYNDPNLKQVFITSLPEEIHPELHRVVQNLQKNVKTMTLGEIHQMTIAAIDKLCEQQNMFKALMENKVKMKQVCSKKHMTIKCSDKEKCHCPKLGKKKKKNS